LSKGFETFQKLDDTADEHLDSLLKTIAAHEQETGSKIDAQVITWRGMMTKILTAPFSKDGYVFPRITFVFFELIIHSFQMNATFFEVCQFSYLV